MRIIQSRSFAKRVQQFRKQEEKKILDKRIRAILDNPNIGLEKRGELRGVYMYKFKIHTTEYLLSYQLKDADTLELIMIGPHENYYRDLEKYMNQRK